MTGRHQISVDGRHLIDGVPFGKPYLQRSASSRPSITIPPRKRRRLAIGGWDGETEDYDQEYADIHEDETAGKELALVNRDSSEESSMDDYDAEIENADEEDLSEEIKELEEESRQADSHPDHINSGSLKRRRRRRGLEMGHEQRESAGEMHSPATSSRRHSSSSESPRMHPKREKPRMVVLKLSRSNNSRSKDDARDEASVQSSPHASTPKSGRKSSSIAASTPPSRKVDKMRNSSTASPPTTKSVRFQKAADVHYEKSSSEEETSDSESQEVSDESSESDTGDGSESDSSPSNPDQNSVSSSTSSSASNTSSSDSDDDVSSSESDAAQKPSSSVTPPKKQEKKIPPKVNPPGDGSGPTKSNNRRSKMRRRLIKMKSLGILGPESNFADLRNWDNTHGDDPRLAILEHEQKSVSQKKDEQSEFESKRQELLRDLADGGVDVNEFTGKENVPPQKTEVGIGASTQSPKGSVSTPTGHLVDPGYENLSESASKRMRLDVAGSRRLLFGSLGVRTPKTKEDEEETRKKLAGKVNNAYIAPQKSSAPDLGEVLHTQGDEFDGDWEKKLILKATECVYDDIPLSAPPFPFEQRWDEDAQATIRQRKGTKKSRKRKRNSRYIEQEHAVEEDNTGYFNGDEELNYDGNEDGNEYGPEKQLTSQSNEHAAGDLPIHPAGDAPIAIPIKNDLLPLPDDLSEVVAFTKDDLKAGAIVAFKQLDMSKETNWQPKVSEYRVATIENVDGDTIHLSLAHRDRKECHAVSDEDEGSRTYSGFEMPGYDDEDNAEDDGFREVSFDELIEPKLLREGNLPQGNLQEENLPENLPEGDLQEEGGDGDGDGESSLPLEVVEETQDVSLSV